MIAEIIVNLLKRQKEFNIHQIEIIYHEEKGFNISFYSWYDSQDSLEGDCTMKLSTIITHEELDSAKHTDRINEQFIKGMQKFKELFDEHNAKMNEEVAKRTKLN